MVKFILKLSFCFMLMIVPTLSFYNEYTPFFLQFLTEKCFNVSKDIESYKHVNSEWDRFIKCQTNIVDEGKMQNDIETGIKNNELNTVINKYCNKLDDSFKCTNIFYNSLSKCFTSDDKIQIEEAFKIIRNLKEYICSSEGKTLAQFFNNGGGLCIVKNQHSLQICFEDVVPEDITGPTSFYLDKKMGCEISGKLNKCFAPKIRECENEDNFDYVQGLFDLLEKDLSCKNDRSFLVETNKYKPRPHIPQQHVTNNKNKGNQQTLLISVTLFSAVIYLLFNF